MVTRDIIGHAILSSEELLWRVASFLAQIYCLVMLLVYHILAVEW